jgi:hypothetical protein
MVEVLAGDAKYLVRVRHPADVGGAGEQTPTAGTSPDPGGEQPLRGDEQAGFLVYLAYGALFEVLAGD